MKTNYVDSYPWRSFKDEKPKDGQEIIQVWKDTDGKWKCDIRKFNLYGYSCGYTPESIWMPFTPTKEKDEFEEWWHTNMECKGAHTGSLKDLAKAVWEARGRRKNDENM